jgi:phosphoglycerate dehydrogenase-like enzyme
VTTSATPVEPVATLPFPVDELADHPDGLTYTTYTAADDPAVLCDTAFWVPPYLEPVDFRAILPTMPRLRVVQAQSAGTEHIAPFLPASVELCNARGVHDAATAEFTVALILASLRQLPRFIRAQRARTWDADNTGRSLADSTVLIVGYGSIGRAVGRRLAPFECQVIGVSRRGDDDCLPISRLPEQLPLADVVIVLTPLSKATRHLVDSAFLASMKEGALLVNMSRGGVVDQQALIREAASGRLHAALDVTDPEPLPSDHPLWALDNVIISPHVGGGTTAMGPRVRALVQRQLEAFAHGKPLDNVVTR